jgi:UDP-N-acetylglucosamine:LPS N-acetylglucosamine transferase
MAKVLVVSSVGGHLDEVMELEELLRHHRITLVVNDLCELPKFPFERVYRIAHAERDWRVVLNVAEAAHILFAEDPDILVSTGAGPIVPFAVLARLFGRPRTVFVESAAAVSRPTLTGRLMYWLSDVFFYQWPTLSSFYPQGRCVKVVFR